MRELNIEFLDLYKRVDRFIRDAYASSEGVSEYLRQMEQNNFKGRSLVPTWTMDYDRLKRLRWIRNQLSHEVGYDADLCEETDYLWLEEFRRRLYAADDPMAILRKAKNAERQRYAEEKRRQQAQKQQVHTAPKPEPKPQSIAPKRDSLWAKIKRFFSRRS